MPKLTDEELIAAIEQEESVALDSRSGSLQTERADAWDRYRGELLGNEVADRSQIVSMDVLDTIQWILPSLVRIFLGGDEIGQFEPMGKEDEYAAQCETEVCNWYLQAKNDFYSHIVSTLTDALLLKNGYLAGMWTVRKDVMTETYRGLADEEVAMLAQDPDISITKHTEYPDPVAPQMDMQTGQPLPPAMLHDVMVERKKADEFVAVESIPTDEMVISRRHRWTSLLDCDFVQWRRKVTIGQLRAEGFKVPDDASEADTFDSEQVERERYFEGQSFNDTTPDPARKVVTFKDTYIRIDLEGLGTPKLWRVAYVDGQSTPALKEEADIIPFAGFSPIIYPHSHIGTSVYDLIKDLTLIKTMLQRNMVDSSFLQVSGQMVVDVNRVNLDDFLVNAPGRVKRVDGPVGDAWAPMVTPDATPAIMQSLEYLDGIKEGRTGVTKYSAGLDGNTLNKTATGVQQIQAAANQRIELIARTLASGFRDLFLVIHALASKHSTKPVQLKLKGQWQAVDPRSWAKRTDFKINVGLGTGTPEAQLQKLLMFAPLMQQMGGMGLSGPQEAYNYAVEIWKAAGYRHADKFIHPPQIDPATGQPKMPPPPKPESVQVEEIRQQGKQAELQASVQVETQKAQIEAQAKEREQQGALAVQAANDEREAQLEQLRMQKEAALEGQRMEFEKWKAEFEAGKEAALQRQKMEADIELEKWKANLQTERDLHIEMIRAGHDTKSMPRFSKQDEMHNNITSVQERQEQIVGAIQQIVEKVVETEQVAKKKPKGFAVRRGPDGKVSHLEAQN